MITYLCDTLLQPTGRLYLWVFQKEWHSKMFLPSMGLTLRHPLCTKSEILSSPCFPSVGLAILDASPVWTGGAGGQIRQAGTTKVLIDSISVNTECARSRAPCPRVNADAVALKTRKPAAKQAVSQDRWSPPTESYPRSQRLDFLL